MKKRLYYIIDLSDFNSFNYIIISYKDKKYKKYQYGSYTVFFPEGVKIISGNDGSYYTFLGKLFRRHIKETYDKHLSPHINAINERVCIQDDKYCFETLEAAQLFIDLEKKEYEGSNKYKNELLVSK